MTFIRPDYNNSIVNLMSSIALACDHHDLPYPPLASVAPELLNESRNIILLIVDGLGYHYLQEKGNGSHLHTHLKTRLTSVFPSTTATAITSFMTGLAPLQHGLTGWHMYFRELGTIAAVLLLRPRYGGAPFTNAEVPLSALFTGPPIFNRLSLQTYVISPDKIVDSDFNRIHSGSARRIGYKSIGQCCQAVIRAVKENNQRKFVYVYYPDLDATAHEYGINSRSSALQLEKFDLAFGSLLKSLQGSDTTVMVTADHGFIDAPQERLIEINDHPELAECLLMPLCGERRVAYCYVHPDKRERFENYVTAELSSVTTLLHSTDLLAQSWFGIGIPHPGLSDRIGHYALLMHEDYTIKDWLLGEKRHRMIGVHGGVSAKEMLIPLIMAQV